MGETVNRGNVKGGILKSKGFYNESPYLQR